MISTRAQHDVYIHIGEATGREQLVSFVYGKLPRQMLIAYKLAICASSPAIKDNSKGGEG